MIRNLALALTASLLSSFTLFPVVSIADEIEINVHTRSEPKSALGIIFAAGKVVEQPSTSFERVTEDVVVVKMPYDVSSLPSETPFATAYLLTEDNQIVFGDVRSINFGDSSDSFWRIPLCAADERRTKSQMPLPEQLNYLESLLEVRGKKREVAQKLLLDKLTPELLSKLQKVEKGFGFNSEQPLSSELPALELVERLSRLKNTITLYKSTKTKPADPASSAGESQL